MRCRSARLVVALSMAGAVVGGASACGAHDAGPGPQVDADGAAPSPGQTPTATATATAPPTTTASDPAPFFPADGPPPRPEAMDVADNAGAEAAARYFVEVLFASGISGDTSRLEALAHPDCDFCAFVIAEIPATAAEEAASGRFAEDGPLTFTWVKAFEEVPGTTWTVDVDLDAAPGEVVDAAGTVIETLTRSSTYHADIDVTHDGHRWLITNMTSELVAWSDD